MTASDQISNSLKSFITNSTFPCLMAKAVLNKGHIVHLKIASGNDTEMKLALEKIYGVVDAYRKNPEKLTSLIITFENRTLLDFNKFETVFWNFLRQLKTVDRLNYGHDPRVGSDPAAGDFSYSLKEEAFFILALHPESERFSRRFSQPSIVFNIHQQFEALRSKGLYKKIRDTIRARDKILQGFINPMVKDFGSSSEVFQYLGKRYLPNAPVPSF